MITCHLTYKIRPERIEEFERFGRLWIRATNKLGGQHHGYLLPAEGASDVALGSYSFPSLAAYEEFRIAARSDPDCLEAARFGEETGCYVSYVRTFYRPLTE